MQLAFLLQYLLVVSIILTQAVMWLVVLYRPVTHAARAMAALLGVVSIWQLTLLLLQIVSPTFYWRPLLLSLYAAALGAVMILLWYVTQVVAQETYRLSRLVLAAAAIMINSSLAVFGLHTAAGGEYVVSGLFFLTTLIAVVFFMVACIQTLLNYVENSSPRRRLQLEYWLLALCSSGLLVLLVHYIYPSVLWLQGSEQYTFNVPQLFAAVMMNSLAVVGLIGMVRHRLLGIKLGLRRSWIDLVFSGLIAGSVAAVVYGLAWPLITHGRDWPGLAISVSALMMVLLGAGTSRVIFLWLKRRVPQAAVSFEQWQTDEQRLVRQSDYSSTVIEEMGIGLRAQYPGAQLAVIVYDHIQTQFQTAYPLHVPKTSVYAMDEPWIQWCALHPEVVRRAALLEVGVAQASWQRLWQFFETDYVVPLKYNDRLVGVVLVSAVGEETQIEDWLRSQQPGWSSVLWSSLQIQFIVHQQIDARITAGAPLPTPMTEVPFTAWDDTDQEDLDDEEDISAEEWDKIRMSGEWERKER